MTDEQRPISDAEQFMRMMAEFSDFGEWAVRAVASRVSVLPPMLATLRGRNGRVEVWGGRAHRLEVWFIGKDKSEEFIAKDCRAEGGAELSPRDGSLRAAIARACALAGIQPKLF